MNNIDRYFKDIRKSKPLTKEDEITLAQKVQKGDEEALNLLVTSNLRFVVTIARKYQGRGLELEDLIAEGNSGLIEAARHFDPESGFRFISYGIFWIKQAILAALSANRAIRLPFNKIGTVNAVQKAINNLTIKTGHIPSDKEIARYIGISEPEVSTIREASRQITSLDMSLGESEEDGTLESTIENENIVATDEETITSSLVTDVDRILKSILKEKDCFIIRNTYGIGCKEMTDEQIGEVLKISPERVRQVRLRILKDIRKNVKALAILREYLG